MAPTLTTRVGFSKPATTDLYDVTIPNANWDLLDSRMGMVICTSATRPSVKYDGLMIYETDTGFYYHWTTSGTPRWIRSPGIGIIGGKIYNGADATLTTGPASTTETLTGMDTGSLTLEASRLYKARFSVEYDGTVSGDKFLCRVRSTNTSGTVWGTKQVTAVTSGTREHYIIEALVTSPGAGALTLVLTMARNSGTGAFRIYKSTTNRPFATLELVGLDTVLTSV